MKKITVTVFRVEATSRVLLSMVCSVGTLSFIDFYDSDRF